MPIEREFKYLLRSPDELYAKLMGNVSKLKARIDIEQGYLSRGGRIRKRCFTIQNGIAINGPIQDVQTQYIFTYKHDLSNQPGCLEIETELTKEDYDLAWGEADHKIVKTRFMIGAVEGGGVWEIDFFKDEHGIYLALAEFEVPASAGPPDRLHPLVQEHLVFAVPEDDGRFKNRKLCEREKVVKLLKEIA